MKHLRLFKDREEFNASDLEYPTLSLIQEDNSTVIDEIPPTIIAKYVFEEDIPEEIPCFYSEVNGDNILTPRSFTSFEVNGEEMIVNNPIINLGSITPTASSLDPLSFSEDSFLPAETTYAEIKFSKPVTYLGIYIEPGQISVVPISSIQQELPQLITVYSDDSIRFNCANFLELVGLGQVRMVLFSSDSETPESIEEINSYTPIINSYSGGISLDANLRSWPAGEYTVKMEFDRRDWGQFNGFFYSNPYLREIYCGGNFRNGIYSENFCNGAYRLHHISIISKNFIEEVGDNAFRDCSGLTSITIPESVTSIGYGAFWGCDSLTDITIPESVIEIGSNAFLDCTKLPVENNVRYADKWAVGVDDISLSTYTLRNDTKGLSSTFYNCTSLTSITIPESVTVIGAIAFYGCSILSDITIPESVIEIGNSAFYNCTSLTSITIPESVIEIGNSAFYNCNGLISVNIPESVTEIRDQAFSNCTSLTSITIPESVTSIRRYTFNNCTSLATINIPNSVTSIEGFTFHGCSSLTSINIPESVIEIGNAAFYKCTSLTEINIPESVTSIGNSLFWECTSLTEINIPESVTSIDPWAFYGCTGLTNIICHATMPPVVDISTFAEVNKSIPVYVPASSIDAYKAANYWSKFTNIQAIS